MAQIRMNNGKKGNTFTARVRIKNKEITRTFKRKTDAKKWAQKQEDQFDLGRFPNNEAQKRSVADLFKHYLKSMEREKPKGYKKLKEHLNWWQTHLGTLKLFEVEAVNICLAREELLNETTYRGKLRSPSTANRYMSSLRMAFQFGVQRLGWLPFNIVKQIAQLAEPDTPGRFLDRKVELPLLAEACGKSRNKRLLPLFMLAIGLGLRRNSLVGLHESEVNLSERTVQIPRSRMKRDNMITLTVSDELFPYLEWLYEHRNLSTGLFFPGSKNPSKPMDFENAWKNALKRAGIENYRFHDNRHSAGSYFTESGCTLAEVAALLGQKTLVMALRYSHISDEHKAKKAPEMSKACLAKTAAAVRSHLKPLQSDS
ncbi:hypothetical protein A7E78_14540 [Syntrophotalea acetylenivorans]|uniref:Site-specific integrase n=1 Tax=Syntrophotalea acetylenivorans TaxID=1842532 RepID=A0A1L3GSL5_9BACT|nr:site-specific integrase [Syntrophotalea acetylenivorans]APG28934.1 hypothetical protein A7E78_14540 [Syntrophotalea acetylenivorans]